MAGPGMTLFGQEEIDEVNDTLRSRELCRYRFLDSDNSSPSKVDRLEAEIRALTGARHAIAMNSCSSALITGLWAAGIGNGDEVIVPGYTFVAPISAVLFVGAKPVLAEVDESLTLDPCDVRKRVSSRTRAIFAVHMLGAPCDMDALCSIAAAHDIFVFEDCAQAGGGSYKGKRLGTFGAFGALGMNPFKVFTSGEGGALVTDDTRLYERAYAIHDHGSSPGRLAPSDETGLPGLNFRMPELSASVGLAQIRRVPEILGRCRANKRLLLEAIGGLPHCKERPLTDPDGECATVAAFIHDTAAAARVAADRLSSGTLAETGKHVYWSLAPLSRARAAAARRILADRLPQFDKGSLPQTDDIMKRSTLIAVGTRDEGLGSGFGVDLTASETDILRAAEVFRRVCA